MGKATRCMKYKCKRRLCSCLMFVPVLVRVRIGRKHVGARAEGVVDRRRLASQTSLIKPIENKKGRGCPERIDH